MKLHQHSGEHVLAIAQVKPAGSRNDRRYWYSVRIGRARQLWATVGNRAEVDHFGIQFVGTQGQEDAARYQGELEKAGFYRRNDTRNNATFARKIPFRSDGSSDAEGILQAKTTLEAILQETRAQQDQIASEKNEDKQHFGFASRLRASLPFFVDLELPSRAEPLSDRELF